MIEWGKITKKDNKLICKIVNKANKTWVNINKFDLIMDISATHLSNPLRLKALLEADAFNFSHDINGIMMYLNRTTGQLTNCFSPRFSK